MMPTKKLIWIILITNLIISLLLSDLPVFAANSEQTSAIFAADHILVKFKAGVSEKIAQEAAQQQGNSIIEKINSIDIQIIKVPDGKVQEQLEVYRKNEAVEYAEPDYKVSILDSPDDPYDDRRVLRCRI
jgi:hypothetical protein